MPQSRDKGKAVRHVQEWLCLQGFNVVIDEDYGPATAAAVRRFQLANDLPVTGQVDPRTLQALISPLTRANAKIKGTTDLSALIVQYAERHLFEHPREIGGANSGPWVRSYMPDGTDGPNALWCAAFSTFLWSQAFDTLGKVMPVRRTASCDNLAAQARRQGLLVVEGKANASTLRPGSIFLRAAVDRQTGRRKSPTDWNHAGIVIEAHSEYIETIEGNTNDEGSRDGYEVCRRTRGWGHLDFVNVPTA